MAQLRGIIRSSADTMQVMNSTGDIKTCYYDSYKDTYCIPQYSTEWVSRAAISADGWRFIEGVETLYDGSTAQQIAVDTRGTD